jgi:acyl-CoA thioesterase-1
VRNAGAYPAQLQALLRAKQIDADVTNAGVPFDTTAMMLRRLDREVPDDTKIVILQPGANDRRFLDARAARRQYRGDGAAAAGPRNQGGRVR